MANIIIYQTPDGQVPQRVGAGTDWVTPIAALAAGNANDLLFLGNLPVGVTITDADVTVDATLGAAVTLQLGTCKASDGSGFVALTGATTATTASQGVWNGLLPVVTAITTMVAVKIAGGNVAATANAKAMVSFKNA